MLKSEQKQKKKKFLSTFWCCQIIDYVTLHFDFFLLYIKLVKSRKKQETMIIPSLNSNGTESHVK